jgi:hypothetical protein
LNEHLKRKKEKKIQLNKICVNQQFPTANLTSIGGNHLSTVSGADVKVVYRFFIKV